MKTVEFSYLTCYLL